MNKLITFTTISENLCLLLFAFISQRYSDPAGSTHSGYTACYSLYEPTPTDLSLNVESTLTSPDPWPDYEAEQSLAGYYCSETKFYCVSLNSMGGSTNQWVQYKLDNYYTITQVSLVTRKSSMMGSRLANCIVRFGNSSTSEQNAIFSQYPGEPPARSRVVFLPEPTATATGMYLSIHASDISAMSFCRLKITPSL